MIFDPLLTFIEPTLEGVLPPLILSAFPKVTWAVFVLVPNSRTFSVLALGLKYNVEEVLAVGANTNSELGLGDDEVPACM